MKEGLYDGRKDYIMEGRKAGRREGGKAWRVFNEQFEQEREEFIQRGGAVADERRPTKAPEPSVSLSDAQPAPEPTDEKLDDFFAK